MANITVGSFVTGTSTNENPKTGKALSYVESINRDGSLNLKVVATIYTPDDSRGISGDGFFVNRNADYYQHTTILQYVTENKLDNVYFLDWFEKYAVKEKYEEIEVGALVICTEKGRYTYTNEKTLCYVNRIYSDDIKVTILTNYEGTFDVERENFVTTSVEEYFEKFPNSVKTESYKEYIFGGFYNTNRNDNRGIMDILHRSYPVSDEITEKHTDALMRAYGMFKYGVTHDGCKTKVEACNKAKAGLRDILSHHPNWDGENMWIRYSTDWERPIVPERVDRFINWFDREITKIYAKKEHKENGMDYVEVEASFQRISRTIRFMQEVLNTNNIPLTAYKTINLNGFYLDYYLEEKARLEKIKEAFCDDSIYNRGKYIFLSKEDGDFYFTVQTVFRNLKKWIVKEGHLLTKERASYINDAFSNCHKANGKALIRVNEGMKWSRFIGLLGRLSGVDRIVDIETKSWVENGTYHERQYDAGWNGKFAEFADGINPFTVKRHTIISTNPVDYTFSSNGTSWVSCHHLCREELDKSGSYRGMYSGGCDGYMTDNSTVVMYMIDEAYDGNEFMFVPKERRCLFHIGEDKMIQGRVYPDGRDGGELGASKQMRTIMQAVLADCLGVPNLWKVEEGTSSIYGHQVTEGRNYQDYCHYNDCTISFLKGNNTDYVIRPVKIKIGHKTICPVCGTEHSRENWVYCYDHEYYYNKRDTDNSQYMVDHIDGSEGGETCARCGAYIDPDSAIQDEDTGNYYCDSDCASEDGVYWCNNVDGYHSDYVYYDDYHEEYFYDRNDDHICTEDGLTFMDSETASDAGYVYCDDIDGWVREDDAYYCNECDRWVTRENWDSDHEMCTECVENLEE